MKKNNFVLILEAVCATLSITSLVACGDAKPSSSSNNEAKTVTLTFDLNYENSPAATSVEVEYDDVADEPTAPSRENYAFSGWYSDAACTHKFDFAYGLTSNTTAYAGWTLTSATVTFNPNYDGASLQTQTVDINGFATAITINRDGYNFTEWYTEASCTNVYDFASKVTDNITLYAGWNQKSENDVTLTFLWNYADAPSNGVAYTKTIEKDKKTDSVSVNRDGYFLAGWYTDAACTTSFNFNSRISSDVSLYAKWLKGNTFEAEWTDLTGINGSTYSGGGGGKGMIKKDGPSSDVINTLGASNGFYIADMYLNGCALTFNINSKEAVDDAVIVLRLAAEYFDISLTSQEFLVQVNGTNLSYSTIKIENVPTFDSGEKKEFTNFTINTKVSLNAGENTIKLIVNNDKKMNTSGTLYATAPMVDCMYIYTNTELTWEPLTSNTTGK